MATRYVADAYHPKEPPYQIWAQYNLKQRNYWCFTLVAMVTELPSQQGMWLMPVVPSNHHAEYELNMSYLAFTLIAMATKLP